MRDLLLAPLDGLPVRTPSMFCGYGLYMEDAFFGIISDGRVYFRTDAESRELYRARGMQPLQPRHRPRGPKTVDRNFEVPNEVLRDEDQLRLWARRAASVRSGQV